MAGPFSYCSHSYVVGIVRDTIHDLPLVVAGPWCTIQYGCDVLRDIPHLESLSSIQAPHLSVQVDLLEDIHRR